MSQCSPGTLSRQRAVSRQRVAAAPALLECETLSRANVMQALQETQVKGRERLFPPSVTLWTFLLQVLSPDGSCRDAVTRLRALQAAQGEPPCSPNTGSYCKARGRLPEDMVARLAQAAGHRLSPDAPVSWRWKGRTVTLVDGSTVSMPDTPANQAESPQQFWNIQRDVIPFAEQIEKFWCDVFHVRPPLCNGFQGGGKEECGGALKS